VKTKPQTTIPPLLIDTAELCRLLSVGKTRLNNMKQSGELGLLPARISTGGKSLYGRAELERWVDAGLPPRRDWQSRRNK
jgi:hypothetical protein